MITKKITMIFCILTVFVVFIFFYPTIFFKIKAFDEITPFKELHMPVCFSISEIFELISLLGIKHHFEASNTIYSNIFSIRSNPIGDFIVLITQFLLRKNPVSYHLYSLCLHLINTTLVFLMINKISLCFFEKEAGYLRALTISLLTLIWAIHPVNLESVLLLTNYNQILCYTLCFACIFIYINSFSKNPDKSNLSLTKVLLIFMFFTISLFTAEYLLMLPLVLLTYTYGINKNFKKSNLLPFFIPLIIFVFSFLFSSTRINLQATVPLNITLERIFWLSPQTLFHFIKLLFLPVNLSIDQTLFVKLGHSLLDPYSIFCICFILLIIGLSILSILKPKTHIPFVYLIFFPLILSLVPFSQLLAPFYNLASERYLYFPSFILIFGLSHLVFDVVSHRRDLPRRRRGSPKAAWQTLTLVILFIILCTFGIRSYIRILDWKDSYSLYYSAIRDSKNPLHKAFRYKGLTSQEKVFSTLPHKDVDLKYQKLAVKYLLKSKKDLRIEIKKYQKSVPLVVKYYGLDPLTSYAKTSYLLAHSYYTLTNDSKTALKKIKPYMKDLSILDSAPISFYASLLYYNKMYKEAEDIYRAGLKQNPYSIRIIFPLCELILMNSGSLEEVEKLILNAYKYYPYDTFTLLMLTKFYRTTKNYERFAHFSYIYGLRHHSVNDLENARRVYLLFKKDEKARRIEDKIVFLENKLNVKRDVK